MTDTDLFIIYLVVIPVWMLTFSILAAICEKLGSGYVNLMYYASASGFGWPLLLIVLAMLGFTILFWKLGMVIVRLASKLLKIK